ncbi:MAG: hypothetical protein WBM04_06695 [Candidatus Korobacteraceae bacterium]
MKRLIFAVALCSLVSVASFAGEHDHGFSLRSFSGSYSLAFNGDIAGTGVVVADGRGNSAGTMTVNLGTAVCQGTLDGPYTVNSDGTGTYNPLFTITQTIAGTCPVQPIQFNTTLSITSPEHMRASNASVGIRAVGQIDLQDPE